MMLRPAEGADLPGGVGDVPAQSAAALRRSIATVAPYSCMIITFIICFVSATIGSCEFPFPRFPAEFEIPDDWWVEAGMAEFVRRTPAYRSTTANLVALDDIEPPFRLPSTPLDWRGFDRTRMVSILQGFVAGEAIPPIDLLILPTLNDISGQPFKYRVLAGVHQFYASMAAGFEFLPSTTRGVCS